MVILLAAAITAAIVQQTSPPPPPVVMYKREPGPHAVTLEPPQQQLGRWVMRPVFCERSDGPGGTVQAIVREPDARRFLAWSRSEPRRPLTLEFRIDASGRPLSIRRRMASEFEYVPDAEDVAPALAASRFATGGERSGCTATFVVDAVSIAGAPIAELMAYAVFPTTPPPKTVWQRITPAGSTCTNPSPDVLLRGFPAFGTLPEQPGYATWSMTGYDLDRGGKPRNLQTLAGTGTAALDRTAREAVAKSRFVPGVRVGCFYPYHKNGTILPAPVPPQEDAVRSAGSTCPREHGWDRPPVLTYPAAYRRRSIEGWAMVTYDVAPWGQTGNVRVLQSEPTSEFGDAAAAMIRSASFRKGGTGYTGCVDRVRYVMRKPGTPVVPEAVVD